MSHLRHAYNDNHNEPTDDDDEDDDSFGSSSPADRIRRHYHHHQQQQQNSSSQQAASGGGSSSVSVPTETIQVKLNESYFARERRLLVDALANVRQTVSSVRMFNPAKNESVKQQAQQEWNEKVSVRFIHGDSDANL